MQYPAKISSDIVYNLSFSFGQNTDCGLFDFVKKKFFFQFKCNKITSLRHLRKIKIYVIKDK